MRTAICLLVFVWVCITVASLAQCRADESAADLKSSVPAVRRQAAARLGRAGDRSALPALIDALRDPDKTVRREAAKSLGFIKDARAVPRLLEALGDDDRNVRLYAAYALGEIKDKRASAALTAALADPEWCVRDQAAWALREIGDPAIIGSLAPLLDDKNADVPHIAWLVRHLAGSRAAEELAALLNTSNTRARLHLIGLLGTLDDKATVGPLIAALNDVEPAVRLAAVEALADLGDERAEKPLAALIKREKDPLVLEAAKGALVRMSCEKDLAAHWSFDDRNAKIAKDITGRGSDGQILGCQPVQGKVGRALRFARGAYIELGHPAAVSIGGQPFTVMAWVKSDAADGVVVARGGAFCGFSLYIKEGTARFGIHREQDGPTYIAIGKEKVVGEWVHLAGVVKEDRIELFVGGKPAATAKTKGHIPGNCGQGMEIGFDVSNSPTEITDAFQGLIALSGGRKAESGKRSTHRGYNVVPRMTKHLLRFPLSALRYQKIGRRSGTIRCAQARSKPACRTSWPRCGE